MIVLQKMFLLLITDIDECSPTSPCDVNAMCNNADGTFTCNCNMGYTGNGFTCIGLLLIILVYCKCIHEKESVAYIADITFFLYIFSMFFCMQYAYMPLTSAESLQ